ncbi:hypothetical protein EAL2_c10210 [Peptoclostridium acidaminophilum DSM 3953]|uniref:Uncharacterized protein n=1 Tax=Peptoclostridium acidaminophilum DSM 3953 TaxID=1286171 RepID=W8T623_PEPAC|nr:hypothetical protein [Peptoclostridium acidaminophilum]AHM56320.1 hypothetical protein EAL2_c10210 [Peptoclostridium acidaminophilum DSM 3953]
MITAYMAGISTGYEGEDIEIRYSIYNGQELIRKDSVFKDYKKPAVVGPASMLALLKELEEFNGEEITVIANDPALNELVRGTSTTQNRDVLKMAGMLKKKLAEFSPGVTLKDVSQDKEELAKWDEELK